VSDRDDRGSHPGRKVAAVFILLIALAGMGVLGKGALDAVPLVNFGTDEERAAIERGKDIVVFGVGMLVFEGVLLALARAPWHGLVTAGAAIAFGLLITGGGDFFLALATFLIAIVSAFASAAYVLANA
jgi:hypothetical protein